MIFSGNEILKSIKGHSSITNMREMMCNNPNLDLVNINAYTKIWQNSINLFSSENKIMMVVMTEG